MFFVIVELLKIVSNKTSEITSTFPVYLYLGEQDLDRERRVNFDPKFYMKLRGLTEHPKHGVPDEVQVFDYIYGVLYCPTYREAYAEFLKTAFPGIPWPKTPDDFWSVSDKGAALRRLHLMEPDAIGDAPDPFTGDGDNVVKHARYGGGKAALPDQ